MRKPLVSVVICSIDEKRLAECVKAIDSQNYPLDKIEFIIMKGYLPEGKGEGKNVGCSKARGEFILVIDEDNIVQGKEWLNDMLRPMLEDDSIIGSHCRLLVDKKDPLILRYIALVGTDPVMAYRSFDGKIGFERMGGIIDMNAKNMLVSGGNCFIYRKSALDRIGGYVQDTDNIASFVEQGMCRIAIPKDARTHHFAASSVRGFLKKKMKWGGNPISRKFKWIPDDFGGKAELAFNIFLNLTVIANIFIGVALYMRDKEAAWMLHPMMAFLVTCIYGYQHIKRSINGKNRQ